MQERDIYENAVLAHLSEVSAIKRAFFELARELATTDEAAATRVVVNTMRLTQSTTRLLDLLQQHRGLRS